MFDRMKQHIRNSPQPGMPQSMGRGTSQPDAESTFFSDMHQRMNEMGNQIDPARFSNRPNPFYQFPTHGAPPSVNMPISQGPQWMGGMDMSRYGMPNQQPWQSNRPNPFQFQRPNPFGQMRPQVMPATDMRSQPIQKQPMAPDMPNPSQGGPQPGFGMPGGGMPSFGMQPGYQNPFTAINRMQMVPNFGN